MLNVSLVVNFIALIIILVIIFLVGRWGLGALGLGEPWPKVLALVVALIALVGLYHLFLGGGPFIHVGDATGYLPVLSLPPRPA